MIITIFSSNVLPVIFIPLFTLVFPQMSELTVKISQVPLPVWVVMSLRIMFFLVNIVRLLPITFSCGPAGTLAFLTVLTFQTRLSLMEKMLRIWGDYYDLVSRRNIAFLYRKMQTFAILSNGYLQQYVWTAVQFNGSALIIALLFSIINFRNILSKQLLFVIILTFVTMMIFLYFLLDCASRPFHISRKVVKRCSGRWRKCQWSLRFFKSCQPITLKIGPFHKIDTERAPLMIRFCLQRTFFLSVEVRQSQSQNV